MLERKIRAFNPWPIAFSYFSGSEPIRILSATVSTQTHTTVPGTVLSLSSEGLLVAVGNGTCLNIDTIQLPGKTPQPVKNVLQNNALRKQLNLN